jgi:hypothetical protein
MRKLAIVFAMTAALVGCVSMVVPMERLENVPVSYSGDVGQPIERALVSRNWAVTGRRPGEIDATLIGAEFRVAITVAYTQNSYSVRYRSSEGLSADGTNIHRHYNNWLNNLRISIERETISLPPAAATAQ